MRLVVGIAIAATTGLVLGGLVGAARADIYSFRDARGVLHITNAPATGTSEVLLKEAPKARPIRPLPLLGAAARAPHGPTTYDGLIRTIAEAYDVEYALVKAIIKAESGFNRHAVSRAGALGLMQLMPATAAQHQVRNAFSPRDNIEGGVRHLRMLLDRYGGNIPLAVAAYNAGHGRVEAAGGVPAIRETREYLARVLRYRVGYMREAGRVYASR